jgi:hypothetical protein
MNVWDAGNGQILPNPDNPAAVTAPSSKNPAADPAATLFICPCWPNPGPEGFAVL